MSASILQRGCPFSGFAQSERFQAGVGILTSLHLSAAVLYVGNKRAASMRLKTEGEALVVCAYAQYFRVSVLHGEPGVWSLRT